MPAVGVVGEILCAHNCCYCFLGVEVYLSLFLVVCRLYVRCMRWVWIRIMKASKELGRKRDGICRWCVVSVMQKQ